ncbi:TAXI family TRAP transporter solute-binding subunit [Haloechinothrix sp. LS1_15]|uniref:TAXI family TRAP transporter solute-binding subunit n=1 Tax=Haloechinothrix sp. LS1_15 TaxID=2652248 RepID=UPI00294436C5|nr:TAXI family TRAP transporter solute-binding subunit [Haloechinothrix sp. LS1_15]MDV6014500.1 TAXI family TRAP transporter solute-binding subunit [Haloechinothrix sp. LS1_15]
MTQRSGAVSRPVRAGIALAASGALVLAGCDVQDEGDLTLATGSTGGTYYPLGGEIAVLWSDDIEDVNVSTQSTGASKDNMELLDAGENEVVMAVNGTAAQAVTGEGPFADEPLDNPDEVVALGNVYREVMQIVTTADTGIESIEDLEGARVEIGPPGSATRTMATEILEVHGIDPDTDLAETFDSDFGPAATNLGDGVVDAAFGILGVPTGSLLELGTTSDIVMLDVVGDPLDELLGADESLSTVEIPADTYPGQDEPNETVTNWATLYATPDLDEDIAYDLVRVMYEESDRVQHDVAGDIQLETAIEGLGPIELHPGAERYYEEQGLLD